MEGPGDPETQAILEASRFWVQRVLVPITVVIGITGNTITVMVLTRRRMRSSTNTYLTALAIADIIHLFFVFLLSFKHYPNIDNIKYELYWRFLGIAYWLCDAASSTSIWLTVSFTVERYIAVCHPMKGKFFCTERRAKSIIVIVYIFCTLTTVSTTFEHHLSINQTCVKECETDLQARSMNLSNSTRNGTLNHYAPNHALPSNAKFTSGRVASHPKLGEKYFKKLKHLILSNCTSQPCIIYVPPLPPALNVPQDKVSSENITDNLLEAGTMSDIQEINLESVLEKPMSEAEIFRHDDFDEDNATDANETCCFHNKIVIRQVETDLSNSETYKAIIRWYSSVFFWFIPLTLIATFNSFLVRAVYLSQKIRRQMTNQTANSQDNMGLTNEKRITVMLIGVVILFMICQTPTGIYLIYTFFHEPETEREKNVAPILGNFFNLLCIVNATCNFMLYCLFSKKFRSTFKMLIFERKKKKQDVIMLSSTRSKSSQKFNPYKHGIMKRSNASDYRTPRNLETQSLTSIPRSKSLIMRPIGKTKSSDIIEMAPTILKFK